jgi:predicted small lipoprotein YifL
VNPSPTSRPRRNVRPAGMALLSVLVLAALAAALAGCGSKSSNTPAAAATPTAIQVMATATRSNLTQSTMGTAKVTKSGGRLLVVATIDAQSASSVAEGQTAMVFFLRGGGSFPQAGQSGVPRPQGSGMPEGAPSGMPQPQGSGMPQPQGSGAPFPQGGQGGFPDGQGGFPGGQRGGTAGTVTAVTTNSDGSAAATISVDKLPSGVKNGSSGFARIEVKVLASNVVLIPTAAVKGSGSSATVQVSANGTTETRTVTAGQQSGGMTEIVSGLNEGENVVYSQAFRGFPGGGGQSGMPFPQGGQSGMPFPQQGGQSGGSF